MNNTISHKPQRLDDDSILLISFFYMASEIITTIEDISIATQLSPYLIRRNILLLVKRNFIKKYRKGRNGISITWNQKKLIPQYIQRKFDLCLPRLNLSACKSN